MFDILPNKNPSTTPPTAATSPSCPAPLSDLELYQLCQQYGQAALQARRKFLGLLPEVQHRELWKKKGFTSIFEFAAKLAGISEEQVRNVINLEKKFADKPALHTALVEGTISTNKLVRVAAIATPHNQQFWATQAENLSTRALETLVRDAKLSHKSLHVQPASPEITTLSNNKTATIELEPETAHRLAQLQERGIDIDAIINAALDQRELTITAEKEKLARKQNRRAETFQAYRERVIGPQPKAPRYLPIKIRHILRQEYGGKCSVPACHKPAAIIHHTARFALHPSHDPRFLAPLCRAHHEIAHKIDLNFNARTPGSQSRQFSDAKIE